MLKPGRWTSIVHHPVHRPSSIVHRPVHRPGFSTCRVAGLNEPLLMRIISQSLIIHELCKLICIMMTYFSDDFPMMIKRELSDYPPFCFKMAEGLITLSYTILLEEVLLSLFSQTSVAKNMADFVNCARSRKNLCMGIKTSG